MMTETVQKLNEDYPGWHLHCNVTTAGINSLKVDMIFTNADGEQIASVTQYGSGSLNEVKNAAFNRLYKMLRQAKA